MTRPFAVGACLLALASPAYALNILLTNDDGLTSNLKALYEALKADSHDVVVSVPCTGQSGRGAGIVMYSTETIIPDNDKTQVEAEGGCHNGAAPTGAPAAGPFLRTGYSGGDYHYAHGTPVMATLYGLELATTRWGRAPDVVLSGPNEGQNVGSIVNSSGTIGNAQAAAARGVPAIALSAGTDTVDNAALANPNSVIVAQLSLKLLRELASKANGGPLLPAGVALNVNFPNAPTASTPFAFSRHGTFNLYVLKFNTTPPFGLGFSLNSPSAATPAQAEDESLVVSTKTSVTAMQVGFDHRPAGQTWLRLRLSGLLGQ